MSDFLIQCQSDCPSCVWETCYRSQICVFILAPPAVLAQPTIVAKPAVAPQPTCNPPCQNGGQCATGNICICTTGFSGPTCAIRKCEVELNFHF
jgi:hypothetical protein